MDLLYNSVVGSSKCGYSFILTSNLYSTTFSPYFDETLFQINNENNATNPVATLKTEYYNDPTNISSYLHAISDTSSGDVLNLGEVLLSLCEDKRDSTFVNDHQTTFSWTSLDYFNRHLFFKF